MQGKNTTRAMRHPPGALEQRQSLALPQKIRLSERRITAWYNHWQGQVFVAFSGGKDSTVLLHLVRSRYPEVPAVFYDTGLEFPEIRDFALSLENVIRVRPRMSFRQVIEKHGYPVISKRVAQYVKEYQRAAAKGIGQTATMRLRATGIKSDGTFSQLGRVPFIHQRLFGAPFKVSDECCHALKGEPADRYARESGRYPYVGTMACESLGRRNEWNENGCNVYDSARPNSKPLSVWTEDDVWAYLRGGNRSGEQIPYSPIYDNGHRSTGCAFCMFGCHMESSPNRFQVMERTHPKLHAYCMRSREDGGLGLREVLEFIGVPWRNDQMRLFE